MFLSTLGLSCCLTVLQSIRREAPKIGGSFAVWGGLFSTFDCTLVALRKKVRLYAAGRLLHAEPMGCHSAQQA